MSAEMSTNIECSMVCEYAIDAGLPEYSSLKNGLCGNCEHYETLPIEFPSAPIAGETLATVQLVSHDWRADEDWERFEEACRDCAHFKGHVDPNWVRGALTNAHGLTIEPHRFSSFWSRATNTNGFLDNIPGVEGWTENSDTAGGNQGKPLRLRRLRPSP